MPDDRTPDQIPNQTPNEPTDKVLALMSALGYPTDPNGVCYGLALMALAAWLHGEYPKFQQRMDCIEDCTTEQILDFLLLAKGLAGTELLEKTCGTLTEEEKNNLFTEEEKECLLSIDAFLFQVAAYQDPQCIQDFLGIDGPALNQADTTKVDALMCKGLATFNPMIDTANADLPKDQDEELFLIKEPKNYCLSTTKSNCLYLKIILEKLQDLVASNQISLLIQSGGHTLHLHLDDEKLGEEKMWHLTSHSLLLDYPISELEDLLTDLTNIFTKGTTHDAIHLNIAVFIREKSAKTDEFEAFLAKTSKISIASLCVDKTKNINVIDCDGYTLLHLAALYNAGDVVSTLLKNGANVNALRKEKNITALHCATAKGYRDVVKLLLENQKIDVHIKTSNNITALKFAKRQGHTEIAQMIIRFMEAEAKKKQQRILYSLFGLPRNDPRQRAAARVFKRTASY